MTERPDRLPPPPEYWQASATIVGILALAFQVRAAVSGHSEDWLANAGLVAGLGLFSAYLFATVSTREYRRAGWILKLQPWLIVLGVMAPVLPCWNMVDAGLHEFAFRHFDYKSLICVSSPLVPLFNWICIYRTMMRGENAPPSLHFMNGVAMVLAAVCAITLLTLNGVGQVHLMVATMFGATLAASALAIVLDVVGRKQDAKRDLRSQAVGVAAVLLSFAVFVLPQVSYEFHSVLIHCAAASDAPAARRAAVRLLRAFGNKDEILRTAYGTNDGMTSFVEPGRGDISGDAKSVFCWVYGTSYNEASPPFDVALRHFLNGDSELAGEAVGAHSKGVNLSTSLMQAWTDRPTKNAMQFDWTMEFENASESGQEARFVIAMPKDGVVSRAVLWVNGMPREAIITSTGAARQAYQNVVLHQKRDPLLVTWVSPDRVMVQCFPVPPKSANQRMKIDLTIDAPVIPVEAERAQICVPWITEKNFNNTGSFQTTCTVHQEGGVLASEVPFGGTTLIFGLSKDAIKPSSHPAFERLDVIVDGGAKLEKHRKAIVNALSHIRGIKNVSVHFASDEVTQLTAGADLKSAVSALEVAPFIGGPDNSRLLAQSTADGHKKAVLWIHGPQPVAPATDFSYATNPIYEVALAGGANEVTKTFSPDKIRTIPISEKTAPADLDRAVQQICGTIPSWRLSQPINGPIEALQRVVANRDADNALEIAMSAKIVSPVTSAVALESQTQEAEQGLIPPPEDTTIGWFSPSPIDARRSISIDHTFDQPLNQPFAQPAQLATLPVPVAKSISVADSNLDGASAELFVHHANVERTAQERRPYNKTHPESRADGNTDSESRTRGTTDSESRTRGTTDSESRTRDTTDSESRTRGTTDSESRRGGAPAPTASEAVTQTSQLSEDEYASATNTYSPASPHMVPKPTAASLPGPVRIVMLLFTIATSLATIGLLIFVFRTFQQRSYRNPPAAAALALALAALFLIASRAAALVDSLRSLV